MTTPPCSEGVRWFVLKDAVTASKGQLDAFAKALHEANNRPVQQLNARPVLR
ncbi:MAG: carbonic anhydrase family protein [Proteobacteria bacterium]|nr:carbonic anhydrase family protein [Pseudomonadota bacterium]